MLRLKINDLKLLERGLKAGKALEMESVFDHVNASSLDAFWDQVEFNCYTHFEKFLL